MADESTDPRYPVGQFTPVAWIESDKDLYLAQLDAAPGQLRAVLAGLTDEELNTPYRPGGWTARQIAHHLADSHANWYLRTKLAITEPEPTIQPYDADRWSALSDAVDGPIEASLLILDGLHARWTILFRSLTHQDWCRRFYHPERGWLDLASSLPMHAWHGRHHVAQIRALRQRLRGRASDAVEQGVAPGDRRVAT